MNHRNKTKKQLIEALENCEQRIRKLTEFQKSHLGEDELHKLRDVQYRELINHTPNGVVVFEVDENKAFILRDINQSGEEISGLVKEKCINKNVVEAYPRFREIGLYDVCERVWNTGLLEKYPVKITRDEQIRRWVDCCVYKILDNNIVLIFNDVSEHKKTEEKLESTIEELKLFVNSVIHDLRVPAISVNYCAKRVQKRCQIQEDCDGRKYSETLCRDAQKIEDLLGEIEELDTAREFSPKFEKMNLEQVFDKVYREFELVINNREINWSVPGQEILIKAEKKTIARIIRNLVDNSLKYGGDHLTEIRIEYSETENFHNISVHDNGVGVAKESLKRVFEKYERNHSSQDIPGTGMGLAIVKELVKKHGGKVWPQKHKERGLTVCFSIAKELD